MNISITQHSTLITHNSPKGNISLIMLFVLAIGSLIGLMSTNFVQDMISSTGSLRDFYQSYYISKGGIELGILAVNSYDYGFEDNLTGTEDILRKNLHCQKDCNLSLQIQSRIRPLTIDGIIFGSTPEPIEYNCTTFTKNKIILSGGSSYIIPLFADERSLQEGNNKFKNLLEDGNYKLTIQSPSQDTAIGIGITLGSGFKSDYERLTITDKQALYITGAIGNNEQVQKINKFLYDSQPLIQGTTILQKEQSIGTLFGSSDDLIRQENFNYLFITNLSNDPYSFCLKAEQKANGYTVDNAIVTSIASYGKTTIGLQANIKKPLPDYIINSYSEYFKPI